MSFSTDASAVGDQMTDTCNISLHPILMTLQPCPLPKIMQSSPPPGPPSTVCCLAALSSSSWCYMEQEQGRSRHQTIAASHGSGDWPCWVFRPRPKSSCTRSWFAHVWLVPLTLNVCRRRYAAFVAWWFSEPTQIPDSSLVSYVSFLPLSSRLFASRRHASLFFNRAFCSFCVLAASWLTCRVTRASDLGVEFGTFLLISFLSASSLLPSLLLRGRNGLVHRTVYPHA